MCIVLNYENAPKAQYLHVHMHVDQIFSEVIVNAKPVPLKSNVLCRVYIELGSCCLYLLKHDLH